MPSFSVLILPQDTGKALSMLSRLMFVNRTQKEIKTNFTYICPTTDKFSSNLIDIESETLILREQQWVA